LSRRA